MKIIVLGTSFCGSTAFSGALQNIPDLLCIGEAHWLIDAPKQLARKGFCSICGPKKCQLIDPLAAKSPSDSHLYDSILTRSGKRHLCTTDKSALFVQRFVKPKDFIGIVLFKSPEAMVASGKRHPVGWDTLNIYHTFYEHTLTFANNWASSWFAVESEVFFQNAADETEKIADHLSLARPQQFQFPPPGWHNVGGNTAYQNKHFKNVLKPDLRWKAELTVEEKKEAAQHKDSRQTWRKLQHKCL